MAIDKDDKSVRTWRVRSSRDLSLAARELRMARAIDQKDLAAAVGIEPSYLSRLERGRRSSILLDRFLRIFR
ncbi:MAG: helix-turn-helix transcriptional regulator, partial [Acidimicrobiia bacterium]